MTTKDNGERQTYRSGSGDRCGACGWGLYAHECPSAERAALDGAGLRDLNRHLHHLDLGCDWTRDEEGLLVKLCSFIDHDDAASDLRAALSAPAQPAPTYYSESEANAMLSAARPAPTGDLAAALDNLVALRDGTPPYRSVTEWMTPQQAHSLGWSEALVKAHEYIEFAIAALAQPAPTAAPAPALDDARKHAEKGWYEARIRGEILDVVAPGWRYGGDWGKMKALAALAASAPEAWAEKIASIIHRRYQGHFPVKDQRGCEDIARWAADEIVAAIAEDGKGEGR